MTFSVDDLISSLSSSHVGQEAIDLAALQAQLAQTLAAQQSSATAAQTHCNTPTARTPTMSFANWEPRRSRSTSVTMGARRGVHSTHDDTIIEEAMDEDEEFAVEQLIGGPGIAGPPRNRERGDSLSASMQAHSVWSAVGTDGGYFAHEMRAFHAGSEVPELAPSSFATSDPFYAAVEASCQQQMQPRPGFFAQMVTRPVHQQQQSPFYAAQSLTSTAAGFEALTHTHTHTMDPRARFMTTGTVDA